MTNAARQRLIIKHEHVIPNIWQKISSCLPPEMELCVQLINGISATGR
jgi:ABC-type antimicrobial peptide transport system ATPase subunit